MSELARAAPKPTLGRESSVGPRRDLGQHQIPAAELRGLYEERLGLLWVGHSQFQPVLVAPLSPSAHRWHLGGMEVRGRKMLPGYQEQGEAEKSGAKKGGSGREKGWGWG